MTLMQLRYEVTRKYGMRATHFAFNAAARRDLGRGSPMVTGDKVCGDKITVDAILAKAPIGQLRGTLLSAGHTGFCTREGKTMLVYCNRPRDNRAYKCLAEAFTAVWIDQATNTIMDAVVDSAELVDADFTQVSASILWDKISELMPAMKRVGVDKTYGIVDSIGKLQDALTLSHTNREEYVAEFFDCDDFAIDLKATLKKKYRLFNSVVWVIDYSGKHSYNIIPCMEDSNLKVYIVEPQTDELVPHVGGDYAGKNGYLIV